MPLPSAVFFDPAALLALLSLGAIAGLLFSLRVTVRYHLESAGDMRDPAFLAHLEGLTNSPRRGVSAWRLEADPAEIYAMMLEAIAEARTSVCFETYLFWSGRLGTAFVDALVSRARAGVPVKMLLDADGSRYLDRKLKRRLVEGGVELRFFRPFQWSRPLQYNHRTHRKLLVIDGRVGICGGAGIADMWLGPPPWFEFGVRLEGGVVGLLQGAFFQNWLVAGGALTMDERFFPPLSDTGPARGMVTSSSPLWGDSVMRLLYFSAIVSAKRRVLLASPYFLPNWDTTAALGAMALQGVEVRLLLPGPKNDKALPYFASRRLYGPLLAAGVRIFEYRETMMHAKGLVVDGRWASLGSTNFDPRSFFLNSELNVSVDSPAFAEAMEARFEEAFSRADEISLAAWQRRSPWERFVGSVGLLIKDQL